MDLQGLALPEWLPWWGVIGLLVPVAFYLSLFLLMPFSTFGLRARLRELDQRIDALQEEIRGLTLRLPERGLNQSNLSYQPPIPPAPPESRTEASRDATFARGASFGDPVADRMLAYMREKAQSDMQRADGNRAEPPRAPRARAEPRFAAPPPNREADLPPPPPVGGLHGELPGEGYPPEGPPPPLPPRIAGRLARRQPGDPEGPGMGDPRPGEPRIDWPR